SGSHRPSPRGRGGRAESSPARRVRRRTAGRRPALSPRDSPETREESHVLIYALRVPIAAPHTSHEIAELSKAGTFLGWPPLSASARKRGGTDQIRLHPRRRRFRVRWPRRTCRLICSKPLYRSP